MKTICIIADRVAISTKRFPAKTILHLSTPDTESAQQTLQKEPQVQRLPEIRIKWILNNIATFTTSTRLSKTNSHHNYRLFKIPT